MKSRAEQRRFEHASHLADGLLCSLLAALEQGTLLAWSLRYQREDRDVVVEAWRATTNHGLMLELLELLGRPTGIAFEMLSVSADDHVTGVRNRGQRVSGCVQCAWMIREIEPTLTFDEVVGTRQL